jgi:energy-coupling factor transporter ATP-binding protein EcfA2
VGAAGLVRELWRWNYRDRLIGWISAGLDRGAARFGRRYRDYLLTDLRFIDLKGLTGRFYTPELDEIYVDVALQPRDPAKVPSSDLPTAELTDLPVSGQRQLITDFLGKPRPRVLAVIGAPGSGKTTLLRHTARVLCMQRGERRHRRTIPVLLYLRDHAGVIVGNPRVSLPGLVSTVLERYGLTEPPNWLERRLRAGECVVLLDGLDEVARQEDRQVVADWVTVQVTRYSGNDFVITSRPLGYQSTPIEGAITLQTQPFTAEQVSRFVHGWYLAVERHSTGVDDAAVTQRAAAEADELITLLRAAPSLRVLTVNPLLLTMIATVHRHHGALPGSRTELYAQICQVLLWRRQAAKRLVVEPRGQQKELLMRVLAFEMMRRQVRDLATGEAMAIMRPLLRRISRDLTVEEFLESSASSGLFIERENGVRSFAHLTFQEYLAAAHIKDKNLSAILITNVSDIWWRETTLLYVTGTDGGPIVEACLNAGTLPALTLAFDCAEQAGELAEYLQDKLDSLLVEGLAPTADPQLRRLMVGVTVARHLRNVVDTDSGTRVCSQPVTANVYGLFLEDMVRRGTPCPPDAQPVLPSLTAANRLVTGARGSDAVAFVNWVNEITDGQPGCRLPTLREIQDPAVVTALKLQLNPLLHSIWHTDERLDRAPQLSLPPGVSPPWMISAATIRERLTFDFHSAPFALGVLPLIIHACAFSHVLRVLVRSRDFTRVLDVAGIREAGPGGTRVGDAAARTRRFTQIIYLAHNFVGYLDPNLADALERAGAIASAHTSISDISTAEIDRLTSALDFAVTRSITLALRRSYDHDLAQALRLELQLDRNGDVIDDRDFDLSNNLDRALARTSERCLGIALSRMLNVPPEEPATTNSLSAPSDIFARSFIKLAVSQDANYTVPPDMLTDKTSKAIADLIGQLDRNRSAETEWTRRLIDRFEALSGTVLSRKQQVANSTFGALRIMAICLAAEADALQSPKIGDEFRGIAAGISWIEGRLTGGEASAEIIVLASSWTL